MSVTDKPKGPTVVLPMLEIGIFANERSILEALKGDNHIAMAARGSSNIVFDDCLTPEKRMQMKPNQRFLVIDVLDEHSIPLRRYQMLKDEAAAKGATVSFLPMIRDLPMANEEIIAQTAWQLTKIYAESDAKATEEAQLRFDAEQAA